MTRSVTFNGITKFTPGGITKINGQALAPIGISATGIVALIGEAEGGAPREIITVDDPAAAGELFRSGALADAIRVVFDPSNDQRIPGGAFRALIYKTNNSTQASTSLPGDEAEVADTEGGASTTTVINLTTGGLTPDAHIGRWLRIGGAGGERRRIVDNDATSVTVSPGFSSAPSGGAVDILEDQMIITSEDYGAHTNQIGIEFEDGSASGTKVITLTFEDSTEQSSDLGNQSFLQLKYVGGPIIDSGTIDSIADDVTLTIDVTSAPVLNAWAGMVLQFSDGSQRLIAGNTAADPSVVTLDAAHGLSTAQQTDLVATTATIRDVTAATGSMTGANGLATGLTTAVTPTADDLSITFSDINVSTLRELVDYLNANTNYEAVIPAGVNPDTTLLSSYDFGTNNTAVNVLYDSAQNSDNGKFERDLQVMVDWINDNSDLVTAVKATTGTGEGSEIPLNTGGVAGTIKDVPVFLTGGTRGTSSNSDWQDGFDELLKVRAAGVVPLISADLVNEGNGSTATLATVAAQLKAHVQAARGASQSERAGYIGMSGTKTEVIAQAAALNDTDVQIVPQKITTLDVSGNLVELPEWAAAASAAGMRAGAPEIGEPLTFKLVKTTGISQDSSWDPKDLTDRNAFIAGGVMFIEAHPTAGFRWNRDITTHLTDDNIAFIDGNTRDAVRFIAYDLRTFLENEFTGEKAKPATVASIRERTAARLQTYKEDSIIVDSLDPENPDSGVIIPGFRRIRVSVTGNVATIKLEVFPVTGIVFQLSEIFLQLPRLSA